MSEYLKQFSSELIKNYTWQNIIESGEPIDRVTLSTVLLQANKLLTSESGPNQERRREITPDWFNWWRYRLQSSGRDRRPALLLPHYQIKRYHDPDYHYGALFVGGLEGHRGHRQAIDWMLSFVRPIILFEQDGYFVKKERQAPFLPLEVRLSMWSYYSPNLIISVLPPRNIDIPESTHYQALFNETGADYCFATEGDPFAEQKRARGKYARFTLIPRVNTESTTLRVQKLL